MIKRVVFVVLALIFIVLAFYAIGHTQNTELASLKVVNPKSNPYGEFIRTQQVPPTGYIPPYAFVGKTSSGTMQYMQFDSSGNLLTASAGGSLFTQGQTPPTGYVTPYAMVGQTPTGAWVFLQVDANGNLLTASSGGGGLTCPGGCTAGDMLQFLSPGSVGASGTDITTGGQCFPGSQCFEDAGGNFGIQLSGTGIGTGTFNGIFNGPTSDGINSDGSAAFGNGNATIDTSGVYAGPTVELTTRLTLDGGAMIAASPCTSAASPAVCSDAIIGHVAIPAAGTTLSINTTSVTAESIIMLTVDQSLGSALSVTCNTTSLQQPVVTARTAATSFSIAVGTTLVTNPECVSYLIMN